MAYDESTILRIRTIFTDKGISFIEKKMFSGICFMVGDKMCTGTHIDKKSGQNYLLCRISENDYEKSIGRDDCIPMDFSGKSMKGFIFVLEKGFQSDTDLAHWLQLCLDFNPLAKKSKK